MPKIEKWGLLCKENKALSEKGKEDHILSWKNTFVQKHVESLREEKARVLCEDQKSGVILPFLLKILQEGRRKKLGKRVPSDLRYVTKP